MDGLAEGEEIVTNGTFSVDAAAQLAGKTSMMNPSESEGFTQSETLTKLQFKVSGECEMCKDRIETAAKTVSGVKSAEWSAEKQMLDVEFDAAKTNSGAIQKAIAAVGHDTEKFKAPDSVYKALPECCLYRK
jgi:Cu(I)/Ag(I) efflux system membrane fusion protein